MKGQEMIKRKVVVLLGLFLLFGFRASLASFAPFAEKVKNNLRVIELNEDLKDDLGKSVIDLFVPFLAKMVAEEDETLKGKSEQFKELEKLWSDNLKFLGTQVTKLPSEDTRRRAREFVPWLKSYREDLVNTVLSELPDLSKQKEIIKDEIFFAKKAKEFLEKLKGRKDLLEFMEKSKNRSLQWYLLGKTPSDAIKLYLKVADTKKRKMQDLLEKIKEIEGKKK